MKKKILIRRAHPGLGDQLCAAAAVVAAQEKYGDRYDVCATVGREHWRELFADQLYCSGGYVPCKLSRIDKPELKGDYAIVFDLDGRDSMHANAVKWEIEVSKNEIFCRAVDCQPESMCVEWVPSDVEYRWFGEWRKAVVPDEFWVLQWRCDPGMSWKDYPKRLDLAREMAKVKRTLVLHKFSGPNQPTLLAMNVHDPEWNDLDSIPNLVTETGLTLRQLGTVLRHADLVVGPDSGLLHFAAAVNTPFLGIFGGTNGRATCSPYPLGDFIQAPIDPKWNCHGTAPCNGMNVRNYWCHSNRNIAACMDLVPVSEVMEKICV